MFFLGVFFGCSDAPSSYPTPNTTLIPPPPVTTNKDSGKCISGAMSVRNAGEYERFLAENSHFCQKTGWRVGPFGTSRQIVAGDRACKNWTGPPRVYFQMSLDLKHIQEFKIVPRGSKGGISGILATPILFRDSSILPYNEDRGWQSSFTSAVNHSSKRVTLLSRFGDFNKNENMRIDMKYGVVVVGEITLLNPQTVLSEESCSSHRPL